jgi:hypothetical protein
MSYNSLSDAGAREIASGLVVPSSNEFNRLFEFIILDVDAIGKQNSDHAEYGK